MSPRYYDFDYGEPIPAEEESMLDQLEAMLRPPKLPMAPYQPKMIHLASGEMMVIRPVRLEEIPFLCEVIDPLKNLHRDFYDIVSARVYAEMLGMYVHRVRNGYLLVGTVDGEVAGIVNGRMFNEKKGISYHTLSLKRGARVGSHLFAAKMEHHIEFLGQDEVWIVAESPIGHRRWMLEYPLAEKFEIQHELGGAPSWVLDKDTYYKAKGRLVTGDRPVPQELLDANYELKKPDLTVMMVQVEDDLESRI